MNLLALLIVFFGVVNLIRLTMFIVGSDIYAYKAKLSQSKKLKRNFPKFSVVIPAHNEENTILRAVRSIVTNNYPRSKREIIVVDDGSSDKTSEIVLGYKERYGVRNLKLVRQEQSGKAHALNNAIKNYARGTLVMCLDSDSFLNKNGLRNMANYFEDKKVVAVSANVKIIPTQGLLNLVQQFEYILCYQMKRAQTIFNIEYIIGGIGSTFRRSTLKQVGYYDGDTVTEDIDLTMKILQLGNNNVRVIYGADVIANTESVLNISGLIRQRSRWKWGRAQTFLKNINMFFNSDKRFTKGFSFVYLPFAIFSDIAFLLEPLFVLFIFYIVFRFHDIFTLISAFVVIYAYLAFNIAMETTIDDAKKLKLTLIAPSMYFLFYILSYVEYFALIASIIKLPTLKKSIAENICRWDHVARLINKTAKV